MSRKEERQLRKEKERASRDAKQKARLAKQEFDPTPQKQPSNLEVEDVNSFTVQWSFDLFDHNCDWRKDQGEHASFCGVGEFLKSYSTRTWKDILQDHRRDHPMPLDRLCKEAQDRLVHLNLDDIDRLWRFRFTGEQRLWGIKDGRLFRVIWWDPEHQVYPVEKKNT